MRAVPRPRGQGRKVTHLHFITLALRSRLHFSRLSYQHCFYLQQSLLIPPPLPQPHAIHLFIHIRVCRIINYFNFETLLLLHVFSNDPHELCEEIIISTLWSKYLYLCLFILNVFEFCKFEFSIVYVVLCTFSQSESLCSNPKLVNRCTRNFPYLIH